MLKHLERCDGIWILPWVPDPLSRAIWICPGQKWVQRWKKEKGQGPVNLVNLNHETTIFVWIIVDFNFAIICLYSVLGQRLSKDQTRTCLVFWDQYRRSHGLVFFSGKPWVFTWKLHSKTFGKGIMDHHDKELKNFYFAGLWAWIPAAAIFLINKNTPTYQMIWTHFFLQPGARPYEQPGFSPNIPTKWFSLLRLAGAETAPVRWL